MENANFCEGGKNLGGLLTSERKAGGERFVHKFQVLGIAAEPIDWGKADA